MEKVTQCLREMRADRFAPAVSVSTRRLHSGASMCSLCVSAYESCLQVQEETQGSAPVLGTFERVNKARRAIAEPLRARIEGAR